MVHIQFIDQKGKVLFSGDSDYIPRVGEVVVFRQQMREDDATAKCNFCSTVLNVAHCYIGSEKDIYGCSLIVRLDVDDCDENTDEQEDVEIPSDREFLLAVKTSIAELYQAMSE